MPKEKTLVPKLRFAEFQEGWDTPQLGAIVELSDSLHKTPSTYVDSGYPMIRVADVNNQTIDFAKCLNVSKEVFDEFTKKYKPKKGDIILSRVGTCGASVFLTTNKEVCMGQNTVLLRPKINNLYFLQFIRGENFEKQVDRTIVGSSHKTLSLKLLKTFKIPQPSLPEQKKIAAFLTAVDDRIEQLKRKKTLLTSFKKGVMQRLFSNDECGMLNDECQHDETTQHSSLSIHHSLRFRNEKGEPYPDWQEKKLGEVLKIGSGKDYKHLKNGAIPVYGSGGVMTYVDQQLYDGESVCIGRKGTIDKPRFLTGAFWTVDTLFYTYSFKGSLPKFIFYVFEQINWYKYNEASGVPSLSKGTIEKIKINLPSLPEQTKIANFLSSLDTKIEQITQQITQTQTFKKGLLQQMFV